MKKGNLGTAPNCYQGHSISKYLLVAGRGVLNFDPSSFLLLPLVTFLFLLILLL